jgi:hypothetical protein
MPADPTTAVEDGSFFATRATRATDFTGAADSAVAVFVIGVTAATSVAGAIVETGGDVRAERVGDWGARAKARKPAAVPSTTSPPAHRRERGRMENSFSSVDER